MSYISRQEMAHFNPQTRLLKHVLCGAIICTVLGGSVIGLYNIATGVIKILTFHGIFYPIIGGILGVGWNILTFFRYQAENPYM